MSSKDIILFKNVYKSFRIDSYSAYGLKNILLHFPQYLKSRFQTTSITALKNVSFRIKEGESFGIIGRNGSGKSTTLGLIAGVLQPTKGSIHVKGKVLPLLELGAGFHPELSGRANIILNAILLGMTRKQIIERLDEIIEFAELGDVINRPIRMYSHGMVARLGFSVIAHLEPSIILIDEVLAVGDDKFQKKCKKKLREFRSKGITTILVSHYLKDIKQICDRVGLIENGMLIDQGRPDRIIKEYRKLIRSA